MADATLDITAMGCLSLPTSDFNCGINCSYLIPLGAERSMVIDSAMVAKDNITFCAKVIESVILTLT